MPSPPYSLFPELCPTNFKHIALKKFFLKKQTGIIKDLFCNRLKMDAMVGKLKPVRCGNIFF